jgi:hypothetical protein
VIGKLERETLQHDSPNLGFSCFTKLSSNHSIVQVA